MPAVGKDSILKQKKVLHPNSRKSISIIKKVTKESNKQKQKCGAFLKQNAIAEKMLWIQKNMVPSVCPYTPELTAELLEKYISRHDEELEQIAIKHSIGGKRKRQHANREDILKMSKQREREEYESCGIEIPDILNAAQCSMLRKWDGDLRYMSNFKFRRFGKKHLNEELRKSMKQTNKTAKSKQNTSAEEINLDINKKNDDKITETNRISDAISMEL